MIYGLHVSAGGGITNAPERAAKEGGECLQLFLASPRSWQRKEYTVSDGKEYQKQCRTYGIKESFAHEMYLTSYGTPDDSHRQKSINTLKHSLKMADRLGLKGVVTHLGSHKGAGFESVRERTAQALLEALEDSSTSFAIVENSAGSGGNIGNSFEELAAIYEGTGRHPRIQFCLDTAHLLAAGYEIRQPQAFAEVLAQFDELIGLDNLAVLHLNDSKGDLGSRVDRHENIGEGYIGTEGFRAILNHPALAASHGILEVPGIKGTGPDKENIERLRELK